MGITIALSTCNKPFKPLGYPSGWVKSREGLAESYLQIFFVFMLTLRIKYLQHNGFLFMNNFKLTNPYSHCLGSSCLFTHKWLDKMLVCNWLHSVGQNHFFVMMLLNRGSAIQSASRRFCTVTTLFFCIKHF
jgi:hypothetical protein